VDVQTLKQKPGRMTEIYEAVCQIDRKAVKADDHKKEGPAPDVHNVNHPIKKSESNERHATGEHDKRAGPQMCVYWKM
jgi:hypothetical protein